jgi:hypothetical protein
MLLKIDAELAPMVDLPPDLVEKLSDQAQGFAEQDLLALIDRAGRHFERIHRSTQPRILLEASLVEYCRFESRVLLSDLARRLAAMGPVSGTGAPGVAGGGEHRSASGTGKKKGDASAASALAARPAAIVPVDTGVPGWTGLIDELMQRYPRLGACLMNGRPSLDEGGGRLSVTFAHDKQFQVDSIMADCGTIEEVTAKVFGRRLKVEFELGPTGQADEVREEIRQEVAPTRREELDEACRKDTSLNDLVDLMGGRPLPEQDRKRWDPPGES